MFIFSSVYFVNSNFMEINEAMLNIGKKVTKKTSKPFKSTFQINTIKGVIIHPQLNIPAYTFEEDESYVECRRCIVIH